MNARLFFVFLLIPTLSHERIALMVPTTSAIICWQEDRKLTWDDFQANQRPPVPRLDTVPGAFVEAIIEANAVVYDWKTDAGIYVKTVVRVGFDPQKSWVNKTDAFNWG